MKIIKFGDRQKKAIKRFVCDECGCIFEADRAEYETRFHRNETYYAVNCPCCNKVVYKWED